jgi:bifunctional DNase/RNase
MSKIELEIVALSHSLSQSHNYAVVLGEKDGNRRLPIVIGSFEAQAIAVAMERMIPNRPLTHDLFKNTLDTFDIVLKEVIINKLYDGIFYARLVCDKKGEVYEIDARTSDSLAMAVRYNCPVYTYDFILDAAGISYDEAQEGEKRPDSGSKKTRKSGEGDIDSMPVNKLKEILEDALKEEDYEKAARIRDELNKRKQKDS